MRAKVRGWVTGLDHNIFRYLVRDFLECWVKGWTRVLYVRLGNICLVKVLVSGCVNCLAIG